MNCIEVRQLNEEAIKFISSFNKNEDYPIPSVDEWLNVISITPNYKIFEFREDNILVGISLTEENYEKVQGLYIRVLRMLSVDLFDYSFVWFLNNYEFRIVECWKKFLEGSKIDAIIFNGLINNVNVKDLGTVISRKNEIFRRSLSDNGFEEILSSKNLKRVNKRAKKVFDYKIEHIQGNEILSHIKSLSAMHQERWNYTGWACSLFKKDECKRILQYTNFLDNKLLTVVYNGNEVVAYHYGMIFKDILLYHTPVINIKYLDYSPLKVLMYEVLSYCQANKINCFDTGNGDEAYKQRYKNDAREIFDLYIPLSVKGQLSTLFAKYHLSRIRNYQKKIVRLVNRMRHFKMSFFNKVNVYFINNVETDNNYFYLYREIEEWTDFVDLYRENNLPIREWQYKRFKEGDKYVYLVDNQKILSYGWLSSKRTIWIKEINREVTFYSDLLIYDFERIDDYKYQSNNINLLREIAKRYYGQKLVFYVLASNVYFNQIAIKAGFIIKYVLKWNMTALNLDLLLSDKY